MGGKEMELGRRRYCGTGESSFFSRDEKSCVLFGLGDQGGGRRGGGGREEEEDLGRGREGGALGQRAEEEEVPNLQERRWRDQGRLLRCLKEKILLWGGTDGRKGSTSLHQTSSTFVISLLLPSRQESLVC